jgi:hypothetical protein
LIFSPVFLLSSLVELKSFALGYPQGGARAHLPRRQTNNKHFFFVVKSAGTVKSEGKTEIRPPDFRAGTQVRLYQRLSFPEANLIPDKTQKLLTGETAVLTLAGTPAPAAPHRKPLGVPQDQSLAIHLDLPGDKNWLVVQGHFGAGGLQRISGLNCELFPVQKPAGTQVHQKASQVCLEDYALKLQAGAAAGAPAGQGCQFFHLALDRGDRLGVMEMVGG